MPQKKKNGRPGKYTTELALKICDRLAEGESLRQICRDDIMPDKATVLRWLAADPNFRDQYARAHELQAEKLGEELLEIADDGRNDTYTDEDGQTRTNQEVIARSRLRVDTRKWIMSKLAPKKYGDKIMHAGADGGALQIVISSDDAAL